MQVILDTDPGAGDAFALLWLLALDLRFVADLVGISTVEGNLPRRATFSNACRLLELARRDDVVVAKSAPHTGPHAESMQGKDGLFGAASLLPNSNRSYTDAPRAPARLGRWLNRDPNSITVIALGPLTNLAGAEAHQTGTLTKAETIIIRGGSFQEGNATANAEFNAYANAHAWRAVLRSEAKLVMAPLDISRQLQLPLKRLESAGFDKRGNRVACFLHRLTANANQHVAGANKSACFTAHDIAAVGYAFYPELFETVEAHVSIDTSDAKDSLGRTVIRSNASANATVIRRVDYEGLIDQMLSDLKRFDEQIR